MSAGHGGIAGVGWWMRWCCRCLIGVLGSLAPSVAAAPPSLLDQKLFRFEFDNDTFLESDDAFSAGWSLQLYSPLFDEWRGGLERVERLPGLGDDGEGGRIVRWALGLSQVIVTPHDVSVATPQPNDAPWAGILSLYGSLAAVDNDRLVAVQLLLGCLGPCSGAEQVQRFVHEDLGIGTPPAGWANQLEDRALANLNLAARRKLSAPNPSAYLPGRWASDLAIGGQVALGNLATLAQAQLELRFGWGLPPGFTHVPDPPGLGLALDPVFVDHRIYRGTPDRWRAYLSLIARSTYYEHLAPAEGGRTVNGGFHPGVEAGVESPQLLFGFHVGRAKLATHVTYYRFLSGRQQIGQGTSLDWVNLSFEIRF